MEIVDACLNNQLIMQVVGVGTFFAGLYLAWTMHMKISPEEHRQSNSLDPLTSMAGRSNPAFLGQGIGIVLAIFGVLVLVSAAMNWNLAEIISILYS